MLPAKPFSIESGVFHQPADWSVSKVAAFAAFAAPLVRHRLIIFLNLSPSTECLEAMAQVYAAIPPLFDAFVFPVDADPVFNHATPLIPEKLNFSDFSESAKIQLPPIIPVSRLLIAGTFDHLHSGHKLLLSAAVFSCLDFLTIALTDGERLLGRKQFKAAMQPLQLRMRAVQDFVKSINSDISVEYLTTLDAVGPAATLAADALAVTAETVGGAAMVNDARAALGNPPLRVVMLPLLLLLSHHRGRDTQYRRFRRLTL